MSIAVTTGFLIQQATAVFVYLAPVDLEAQIGFAMMQPFRPLATLDEEAGKSSVGVGCKAG